GAITDQPGSYTVKLTHGMGLTDTLALPVTGAHITLFEDNTASEDLVESTPGIYVTGGIIQGRAEHTYYITIALEDGKTFQSQPEKLVESGAVTALRYEFEARTASNQFGPVRADVFNVYIDADASPESAKDSYVRWR